MKRKRDADEPNPYKVSRANKAMRCGRCQQEKEAKITEKEICKFLAIFFMQMQNANN